MFIPESVTATPWRELPGGLGRACVHLRAGARGLAPRSTRAVDGKGVGSREALGSVGSDPSSGKAGCSWSGCAPVGRTCFGVCGVGWAEGPSEDPSLGF